MSLSFARGPPKNLLRRVLGHVSEPLVYKS